MGQASSKFKVTKEIRAILLSDPAITSIIGDRIFPIVADKNTEGDFIIYQREKYSKKRTKMGVYQQECLVYVNAVSEDYDRSQELAELINESLEGVFTDPDMDIKLEDSSEDYEAGKYIQILLFSIE